MLLPYAITHNDGFPKLLAQIPMFVSLIFCYAGGAIIISAGLILIFGGLGNAITGDSFSGELGGGLILAIIIGTILYFGLSALLSSLGYINVFTGKPFVPPHL